MPTKREENETILRLLLFGTYYWDDHIPSGETCLFYKISPEHQQPSIIVLPKQYKAVAKANTQESGYSG